MRQHPGEEGVSEVVGVMLLVGVTVLAVAIVAVVLLSDPQPGEIPHATIVAGNKSGSLVLAHEGGDPLRAGEYRIYVDTGSGLMDGTRNFTEPAGGVWSIGGTLTYNGTEKLKRVVVTAISGGSETILAELKFRGGGVKFLPDPVEPGMTPVVPPTVTPREGPFVKNKDEVSLFEEANFYPGKNQDLNNLTFSGGSGNDVATLEANFTLQNVSRVDFLLYPLKKPTGNEKKVEINRSIVNGSDGNYTWDVKQSALNPVNNGDKYVMILIAYNSTDHVIGVSARVVPVTGLQK